MCDHDCFKDNVYVIDNLLLCARCFARRALSVHGKEAYFLNGELVMLEYKDLTHLSPTNAALLLRKQLYEQYLNSTNKETNNDSQANRSEDLR